MTDAKESEKLHELERIARGNGYWNHIEPFVEALTRERDEARTVTDAMIDKGWSLLQARCVEDYHGILDLVEREDFAAALTAALTQGDT